MNRLVELPLARIPPQLAASVFCLKIAAVILRWIPAYPELEPIGLAWIQDARESVKFTKEEL